MPLTLGWEEIALRLFLTVVAGALIGINRSEGGHAAGLRTTLLVCLAASVAMIQTSVLITMTGKTPGSFASLDMMRLPLGILTGMGFIGAGAILRRGEMVHGVTTAATLWITTVIGLCLGGGQLGLGLAATALTLLILWALKWAEARLVPASTGRLAVVIEEGGPTDDDLRALLTGAGLEATSWDVAIARRGGALRRTVRCAVRRRGRRDDRRPPPVVEQLTSDARVKAVRWRG